MLKTVVVPLDGSGFAEMALPLGCRLAKLAGAELVLLGVHEPQMALVPATDIPMTTGPDDLELRAQRQEYLNQAALKLGTVGKGPVRVELVEGLAGQALTEWIERHAPDLVVMSTHGRGPVSRFWLGSVADHLIRHVSVPLFLLRPRGGETTVPEPEPPDLKTVLVALDLSVESEAVLDSVKDVARLLGSEITLFTVIEPIVGVFGGLPSYPAPMSQELVETSRRRAQDHLAAVATRLRSEGFRVNTKVVFAMGVAGTILRSAEEGEFDFVATTTHGASGFRRLLMGSVADKILRGADRPVLVLRPPAFA